MTYTLGGVDAGLFSINATTGVVSMTARNFENPVDANAGNIYDLSITATATATATDDDGNNDSEPWSVAVQNVVETVSFTIDAIPDVNIDENVAYVSVTPNIGVGSPVGALMYALGGADAVMFSIDAATGVVSMVARDFENPLDTGADNIYDLDITATDTGNNTDSIAWSVTVEDAMETASFTINTIGSTNVDENSIYTSVTPVISGTPIGSLIYTLGGTDAGLFTIDVLTGVVSMVARDLESPEDNDANNVYDVTITATDSDANNAIEAWNVTVNNVVEADATIPVISLIGAADIDFERGQFYADVGATASDVIDGNIIVDLTADIVTVNPVDGFVAGTYIVTYDVDDAASNSAAQVIRTIHVNDTLAPGISILNQPASVNTMDVFTVTFQFTEIVNGFDGSDILFTNSMLTNFINVGGIGDTYTVDIEPTGVGDISIGVNANAAQDPSSNNSTAAVTQITAFDNTPPDVVVTSAPDINIANQPAYSVSGTCTVGDGNVSVSLSFGSAFLPSTESCSATGTWSSTFDLSSYDSSTDTSPTFMVTVRGSQTDGAGNLGGSIVIEIDKDTVKPNVQIQNAPTTINASEFTISIVFDEDIIGFDSSDISLTNATVNIASFNAVDAQTYTVGIVPDGVGDITLNVAANVAVDLVGNDNNASASVLVILATDDDSDGIPNIIECPTGAFDNTCPDADGDGIPDFQETDSDNDGIPDAVEVGTDVTKPIDSDGDGIPDYRDTDSDGDGISDAVEGVTDSDGDGIPDYVEVGNTGDSDGDGIPDTVECPVYPNCPDTDGDSSPDYLEIDSDNDAINDAVEAGVDPTSPIDTDGDGILDYQDTDSDGDGTDDSTEGVTDNDGDGIPDYVDAASAGPAPNAGDSDGDGIADNIECELYPLCADSDSDGTPDYMETDSDGDGIPDATETGTAIIDTDNDGIDDVFDIDLTSLTGGIDQNGDGIDDTQPLDTDGDGTPDYQDLDSDADGIDDVIECPAGIPCPDTDADDIPDQLDASEGDASGTDLIGAGDSDGDGTSDLDECITGVPCADVDRDGLPDYMDNNPNDGPAADPDNDGRLNYLDPDDDDDSIPDVVEDPNFDADNNPATNPLDSDQDGIADYLDNDSDADGLSDAEESGSSLNDNDGDNIDDSYDIDSTLGVDANNDGIDDNVLPLDSDGDGLPDYLDIIFDSTGEGDSDGDGIVDNVECPTFPTNCPDSDNDGIPDFRETDSDGDGIDDAVEVGTDTASPIDTDGDGAPDYQDTDSDNDGIDDSVEGTVDVDSDGIPDYVDADTSGAAFGGDSDGDGVEDLAECESYPNCADSDNDGTPDYMDADSRPYNPNAAINTGLNGVGSNSSWALFFIPITLLLRRKIRIVKKFPAAMRINK
ncbi:internalin, putative [hydrothermal vent metagenome]|uniref:Internalin, putative n=1 Tax=hydrothermal vent metagenome TaxID=652676 RepID=A0A3B0X9X1_9ZZZZ